MIKTIQLAALAALLITTLPALAQEELAPPDVDFFAELLGSRTDYSNLGLDASQGVSIRGGFWLNEIRRGKFDFGLEGALHWMGEDSETRRFSMAPGPGAPANADEVLVREDTRIRINGYELGGRLRYNQLVYLRAGGFLNTLDLKTTQERTFLEGGNQIGDRQSLVIDSSKDSRFSPFAHIGLSINLFSSDISLLAEYGSYWIDSERLDNINAGLHFAFD